MVDEVERTRERSWHRPGVDPLLQAFGFLGGPIAWFLHLTIAYGLVEIDCRSHRLDFEVLGLPGLHAVGLILTLLAAATALGAAVIAATSHPRGVRWRRMDPGEEHEAEGGSRFLAFTGTVMGGLFALAILTGGSSFILLRGCA